MQNYWGRWGGVDCLATAFAAAWFRPPLLALRFWWDYRWAMSIWLNMVRVSETAFAQIQKQPTLVDAIFFDADDDAKKTLAELGIENEHSAGVDYRSATEGLEAMAEATGEEIDEDDPVLGELDPTGELEFDAGYGPAFYIEPAATKNAVDSMIYHMDEEMKAVIDGAKKDGAYLIGLLS